MTPSWAIIADDLTGCLDTAVAFLRPGQSASAAILPTRGETRNCLGKAAIMGLDCESRSLEAPAAAIQVRQAVEIARSLGAARLYKKMDSMLRGCPEAELQEARRLVGGMAVVCPAVPTAGRTMLDGWQRLNGKPLPQGNLIRRLGADVSRGIPLSLVREGVPALARELAQAAQAGIQFAVLDAVTDADLDTLARAFLTWNSEALVSGAAGLAAALAKELYGGSPPRAPGCAGARSLVMSASFHPVSARQITTLEAAGLGKSVVVPPSLLSWRDGACRDTFSDFVDRIGNIYARGLTPVIAVDYREAMDYPDTRIAAGLAMLAETVVSHYDVECLVLIGGDTAYAMLDRHRPITLELEGLVLPETPALRMRGCAGPRVVTKSGGYGAPDALIRILAG